MGEQNPAQIDSLPEGCGYELLKPIPVVVIPGAEGDAPYVASASHLGFLVLGEGDTPEQARDDLRDILLDECASFARSKAKFAKLLGLAKFCAGNLQEYLKPIE
jgi:hypothetical protein